MNHSVKFRNLTIECQMHKSSQLHGIMSFLFFQELVTPSPRVSQSWGSQTKNILFLQCYQNKQNWRIALLSHLTWKMVRYCFETFNTILVCNSLYMYASHCPNTTMQSTYLVSELDILKVWLQLHAGWCWSHFEVKLWFVFSSNSWLNVSHFSITANSDEELEDVKLTKEKAKFPFKHLYININFRQNWRWSSGDHSSTSWPLLKKLGNVKTAVVNITETCCC